LLDRYYERKGHEKRGLGSELTSKVGSIFSSEVKKVEILISEELAAGILQETHGAFRRCGHLSPASNVAENALKIFNTLIEYLMKEHLQYAINLALSQAPPSEPKVEPDLSLYMMVQEANTVWHLFEKQFNDDLLPLTAQSPKHAEAVQERKKIKVGITIFIFFCNLTQEIGYMTPEIWTPKLDLTLIYSFTKLSHML